MSMDLDATLVQQVQYYPIKGYRIGEEIGGGGFSKVFRAINDAESRVAACKVVNLFMSPSLGGATPNIKELQKEVQVHKTLMKPEGEGSEKKINEYILQFIDSEVIDQTKGFVPGLYMLLELAIGGDLFDKIAPDVGVPEDLAKFYFAQLSAGMVFLHSRGVVHRDLKPENLLLAANGNLKISDFGLCSVFKHKGMTRKLTGRCGSLPYVAPELGGPLGVGYAAEPVDIWGMGIVLYTLLVGNTPWDEPSDNSPEFVAFRSGEIWGYDPWNRIKGQVKDVLLRILEIDPNKRITMSQLRNHQWCMTQSQLNREQLGGALASGMNSTGMMAVANPTFKNSASQAYAAQRSQRVFGESQWSTQFTQQESQFLRLTGNITQGGDFNNTTTRFWLSLDPTQSYQLLSQYILNDLGQENVVLISDGSSIRVRKAAGRKFVKGRFTMKTNDSLAQGGHTLVVMRREEGSILHWKQYWWTVVRHPDIAQYVIKGDQ